MTGSSMVLLLLLVALCAPVAIVTAQDSVEVSIDTFTEQDSVAIVTSGSNFPQSASSYTNGDPQDILGGERDLYITTVAGLPPNLIFTAEVSLGSFGYDAPPASNDASDLGEAQVTWDGQDGSPAINPSGLGGVDFGGPDSAIVFSYYSFESAPITIEIYSGSLDDYCVFDSTLDWTDAFGQFVLQSVSLSSFTGVGAGCDFSNVGAVNIVFPLVNGGDLNVDYFRVDVSAPSETCEVSLYTGGDQCAVVEQNQCVPCSVGSAEYSFRFQCGPSNGTACACTQQEFFSPDCSGSPLQSYLPTQSCSELNGAAPEGSVCFAAAQSAMSYRVNFFHSDPGVVEASCTQLGTNSTCMECTAGGLTSYYTATCDASATPPCVLSEYADSTCSSTAVKVAMNEQTCGQLHDFYDGEFACAFSYEQVP